jgi:uncharacterized cupredoxin-like copper-binding protein
MQHARRRSEEGRSRKGAAWLAFATLLAAGPLAAHGDAHESGKGKPQAATLPPEQKAFGIAGDPGRVDRTIPIRLSDTMRFSPSKLQVKLGETVRFVLRNDGKVMHEMVIGTPEELAAHAELMRKHPTMEHDEPHMAHVAPARRGVLVWHFNRPGTFEFACLIPGHFEAGMRGTITVLAR